MNTRTSQTTGGIEGKMLADYVSLRWSDAIDNWTPHSGEVLVEVTPSHPTNALLWLNEMVVTYPGKEWRYNRQDLTRDAYWFFLA